MLNLLYKCVNCGYEKDNSEMGMICPKCGKDIKGFGAPSVIGTRDGFGIRKSFVHNGREIDNWKKWERAGFSNPLDDPNLTTEYKNMIKDKIEKRKGRV